MERIEVMKSAAKRAGEYMKLTPELATTDKSNVKDFVTVSDIKSQDILRRELLKEFPEAVILSEEDDESARRQMYEPDFSGYVLDPIDGTYNFKRGMMESAISIGYVEAGGPRAGVVYDPYKDEMYEAESGKGAKCNGVTLRVSDQTSLDGASICTSNSYDGEAMRRNLVRHLAIYDSTGVMPWTACPGSGVLIMAWLSRGRFDAYHHNGLKPWDNAAAFLIVREAGGKVVTLAGDEAKFTTADVIVGTPVIVDQLVEIFARDTEWQR